MSSEDTDRRSKNPLPDTRPLFCTVFCPAEPNAARSTINLFAICFGQPSTRWLQG
jgi:hypothetical protein